MSRRFGALLISAAAAACRTTPVELAEAPRPLHVAMPDAAVAPPAGEVVLPIPARAQAAESPPSGWCGETAIQEALLHLGIWAPQRLINRAGRPAHADLYSNEIPAAIAAFGVTTRFYSGPHRYEAFATWARASIDRGTPILAGVKLVPTEHPEWGLDHFVLVVGYGPKGLLVNTTWGRREWIGRVDAKAIAEARAAGTQRISFENAGYGMQLDLAEPGGRARLTLVDEKDATIRGAVTCPSAAGRARVEQRASPRDREPVTTKPLAAGRELDVSFASDAAAYFRCVPVP